MQDIYVIAKPKQHFLIYLTWLDLNGLYILFTVHSLTLFRHRSAIVFPERNRLQRQRSVPSRCRYDIVTLIPLVLGGQERIFEYEIDREGRNRYCNSYFVSPLLKNCREYIIISYDQICKKKVGFISYYQI
jgi:hypothetical protein